MRVNRITTQCVFYVCALQAQGWIGFTLTLRQLYYRALYRRRGGSGTNA